MATVQYEMCKFHQDIICSTTKLLLCDTKCLVNVQQVLLIRIPGFWWHHFWPSRIDKHLW